MLNRLALRLATVRALRGRTFAGNNVRDSEIGPVEDIAQDQATPIICVYTDDGKFTATGRDLYATAGDSRVDVGFQHLTIEILLTQRMQMRDEDGVLIDGTVPLQLDAGLALNLDLIERQVYVALMDPAADAPWSEMWRMLALDVGDRDSQLGSSLRDGVRFSGRQIRLLVRLPRDPAPGQAAGPIWTKFLALAAADADLAAVVPLLQAALAGAPAADWQVVAGMYGLTRDEARALQITPPPAAEVTDPDFGGLTVVFDPVADEEAP